MTIRPATTADQQRVFELLHTQLGEHAIQPPDEALARAINRLLHTPELGRLLVAEVDGRVVGVAAVTLGATIERGGQSAWLEELYVEPEHRGRGLGEALVRAARAAAQAAGATAIDLEVEEGHERAANLYRREGFVRLARQHFTCELAPSPLAPPADASAHEGGCLCGAVRYRVSSAPLEVTHCHCSLCRRSSGAAFVTWAVFPAAAFAFTAGEPRARRSSAGATRAFCGDCGTPLAFREDAQPERIDVTAGSLDRPAAVTPRDHTFTADMVPWLRLADGLPRHPTRRA